MEKRDFFISHTQEDRGSALALAQELRARGRRTWTYEEDSAAATSYLTQIDAAIQRCHAFVLLASQTSMMSHQVIREVERAHECQKLIVVVRLGLTHEAFLNSNAVIRMASGTGVTLSFDPDNPGTTAARVAEALAGKSRSQGIPVTSSEGAPPERPTSIKHRGWWVGHAVAAVVALSMLLLASIRLSVVQMELHASSSRATVTSTKKQNLTGLVAVKELVLRGSFAVDAPAAFPLSGQTRYLRLIAAGPDPIVLGPVEIDAGDRVTVASGDEQGRYNLQIDAAREKAIAVSLSRHLRVESESVSLPVESNMARQLVATWTDSEPASLTFTSTVQPVTNAIAIQSFEATKFETIGNILRPVSAIVEGRIEFPDHEKAPIAIARGQNVRLGDFAGVMSALETADGALVVAVAGTAQAIEIGGSGRPRSQVPTLLEHLTKQPNWVAIGGSLSLLSAIAASMWVFRR
jgi:TIR domain